MYNRFLIFLIFLIINPSKFVFCQLTITSGSVFHIDSGAVLTSKVSIVGNASISGGGKVLLNSDIAQTVDMNGHSLPILEIENAMNVNAVSGLKIEKGLMFTNGKIIIGNNNLTLSSTAFVSGAGDSKFIETNGSGQLFRLLTINVTDQEMPVGVGTTYRPAFVTSNALTYNNAMVGVKVLAVSEPNKPARITDYLNTYWPVTLTGVNGSVSIKGHYSGLNDIIGSESNIRGYFFDGTNWISQNGVNNDIANYIGTPISSSNGSVYGMNKFVYAGVRAFLQGAYNTTTGLMNENLRTPNVLLPSTDPYRNAPYNSSFLHVNNPTPETIIGAPFTSQAAASNNIVDWVFLELRNTNTSPGNIILATRSALIQRDGDIVDMDGISPVLFNNIPDGNYAVTVRHRNHLSMSLSPTAGSITLSDNKSLAFTNNVMDLRIAETTNIYGTSAGYTIASHPSIGSVKLLWGGNANSNNNCKYSGASNDRAVILSDLGNNELGTLSGYNRSDLNMNGTVKYSGASNDRSFLLSNVLTNNELGIRTEQRPN